MSKKAKKKKLVSECDVLPITLLAQCQMWTKSMKSYRIIPYNRHLALKKCDKYETTPLGSISHSSGTNLLNIKLGASDMLPKSVISYTNQNGF